MAAWSEIKLKAKIWPGEIGATPGDDKAKEIEAKRMRRDYMREERAKETEESQKVSQENWVRL